MFGRNEAREGLLQSFVGGFQPKRGCATATCTFSTASLSWMPPQRISEWEAHPIRMKIKFK